MATVMKTPGVYIVEKNAFPNSVVEVPTAVPAFIGYTEWADNSGISLSHKPWPISSMAEFESYFGGPPAVTFTYPPPAPQPAAGTGAGGGTGGSTGAAGTGAGGGSGASQATAAVSTPVPAWDATSKFYLYNSMKLFFANGGGQCYIVSINTYQDKNNNWNSISEAELSKGVDLLLKEQEPTMIVIPDAVLLPESQCISLQQAALQHCGLVTKSRVAILDVWNGDKDRQAPVPTGDCISNFRNDLGVNYLDFGTAYYPWLNTDIVDQNDLSYQNVDSSSLAAVKTALNQDIDNSDDGKAATAGDAGATARVNAKKDVINQIGTQLNPQQWTPDLLNRALVAASPLYVQMMAGMASQLNLLPPSAAIAGVYTAVDNTKGVWKAPANVSLNSVVSPTVSISDADQEDLNVTPQGKSINAIRSFVGEGTLVWGARTLDGNSLDWRYINVRRTMIMLEQSVKLATKAYVFENNVSTTWVTIKSMISNFLTSVWKRGGLAGATPQDAFAVFCGLGETMTADDILEGILRVTVLVAVTHPAEFIEITFQQQMQKS